MKFVVKCTQTWIEATKMGKNKYMKETTQHCILCNLFYIDDRMEKVLFSMCTFHGDFSPLCEKAPTLDNADHRVEFNNNNRKQSNNNNIF